MPTWFHVLPLNCFWISNYRNRYAMLSFGNIFTSDESVVRQNNNNKKDLQELVLMVIVKNIHNEFAS